MKISLKLLLAVSVLSVLAACGNNTTSSSLETSTSTPSVNSGSPAGSSNPISTPVTQSVDAFRPPESSTTPESPMKARDLSTAPIATNIAMGTPQDNLTAAARKNNETTAEGHMGKPLQIGFGRNVAQTATVVATKQLLSWKTTPTGSQVAAINFNSTGAKGMRLGLLVTQLPETATLRFYAKGASSVFEVKGAVVLKTLAANAASGDKSDEGRTYWGPVIEGADATIEIDLPTGTNTSGVNVSIPSVSHMFMTSREASSYNSQATYSGDANRSVLACQVDVTCTTPLTAGSDATAYLVFNKNGFSYSCSGTLLNDNINSSTPYVLTANHCISSQTVAATLYTEFKYRSTTCNDSATGSYFNTLTTGSTLLYTAYNTDSSLVRLAGTPNGGATSVLYAGWDATIAPAVATTIHTVHHPKSDQQRLSRGSVASYFNRAAVNSGINFDTTFFGSTIADGAILGVTLTTGLTEQGSSGSGLFKGTDANPIVIGQLFGGTEPICGANSNNVYGRFDMAFNAGMKDWLVQGAKIVSQLYNASSGIHYYTYGKTDINTFSTSNPAFSNQGEVFKVSSYQTVGLSPVYRFYNTSNGSYFYTISEKERAAVASNTPRMRYDGVVWYASATAAVGTVPLYSAFNKVTGSQYFTTNSATRTNFIAANPQFITDGIAFHVTP